MLKGNDNYPRTVTRTYNMITRFEPASPRHYRTVLQGDRGNMNNCGGHGGQDRMFVQHTAPSGTIFVPGLDGRTPYSIKCFNSENWGQYENRCPEAT